jgi:hypothetical protein
MNQQPHAAGQVQAAAVLRAGLSLWRGELLSGLSSDKVASAGHPREFAAMTQDFTD